MSNKMDIRKNSSKKEKIQRTLNKTSNSKNTVALTNGKRKRVKK